MMNSLFVLLCFQLNFGVASTENIPPYYEHIPGWAKEVVLKSEQAKSYEIIQKTNPFYLEADFNGDELVDIAFHVKNKLTGKEGVMFVNNGTNNVFILGCGKAMGMGSDTKWCNKWFVYRGKSVVNFKNKKSVKTTLRYPAIEVVKNDEVSLIIYWDRRGYKTLIKYL